MFAGQSREAVRRAYLDAWRASERLPLEPLDEQIAAVIAQHPEYQPGSRTATRRSREDFDPQRGATNPFLHLGMHLAIREQVGTDRPAGIRAHPRQPRHPQRQRTCRRSTG